MNIFKQVIRLLRAGSTTDGYYESMNYALKELNDEFTMLHYPFFRNKEESFYQSQINLTDFCLCQLDSLKGKRILEIGCGNGIQSMYICEKHQPAEMTAIDLNVANIGIADEIRKSKAINNLTFQVDDAQSLQKIKNNTYDIVINIESAFHYENKNAFLQQIKRILKPGGQFLIADILTTKKPATSLRKFWKRRMILHHWNEEEYVRAFRKEKLFLDKHHDITTSVIEGFRNYKSWLKNMQKKPFLNRLVLKLFYVINIRLNIFLLRTKRRYLVYVGTNL
ncbi:MAG: class I SAM-dependent methyltransferase [Chlorobi bacterium]|nr:class I SAM-dependent methyltransferase [Chlorobiota bacterium]